jgi:hypothetical protein
MSTVCNIYISSQKGNRTFCLGSDGTPWVVVPTLAKTLHVSRNVYAFYGRLLDDFGLGKYDYPDYNYCVDFSKKNY